MRHRESPGLVVRQRSPLNTEFPFATLSDWLIPADQFFVRNHFPTPPLDEATWRLRVSGAVETPLDLDLPALRRMPQTVLPAVLECAGNGRVYYEPPREGLQWQGGAVGNAAWEGVLLRDVLSRAGLKSGPVEVLLVGADRGVIDAGKKTASPGPIAFARSLPLDKALADGTLLAHRMNGEPLTPEHGFPLRAVVGGWFGMAWVKWITEVRVIERPFLGYWQVRDYFRWERSLGEPVLVPLSEMEVKAQIAQPVNGATIAAGAPYRIFGAAWSGEAPLREVQIHTGGDWLAATLLGAETNYGWRLWEHYWTPPQPGRYALRCRAIDQAGNSQPETQRTDCESYVANWIVPVEVRAVASAGPTDDFVI